MSYQHIKFTKMLSGFLYNILSTLFISQVTCHYKDLLKNNSNHTLLVAILNKLADKRNYFNDIKLPIISIIPNFPVIRCQVLV